MADKAGIEALRQTAAIWRGVVFPFGPHCRRPPKLLSKRSRTDERRIDSHPSALQPQY